MMKKFMITWFHKTAELDNWEKGCLGEYQSWFVEHKIESDNLLDLVQKAKEFTGGELADCEIEPGRLDFQVMENADGIPASHSEMELFKQDLCQLWLCDYSAYVMQCEIADLSEVYNTLKP